METYGKQPICPRRCGLHFPLKKPWHFSPLSGQKERANHIRGPPKACLLVAVPLHGLCRDTAGVRCSCWRACPAGPAWPLLLLFCCYISSINTKKKSLSGRPFSIIWKLASFILFLKLIVSIIRTLQCRMHPQEIITQMYFFFQYTGLLFSVNSFPLFLRFCSREI